MVDKLFHEEFLSELGLEDVVVGGKAQMLHSDRQFVLVKLPLNLEIPNFAAADKGEERDGQGNKTEEQQQRDYEREVAVQMHLMFAELASKTPVLQVEMRHFHPQLKAAYQWMEKSTAKVKKIILPSIGRTSREDKKVFNGFKSKLVYRKRGTKLGMTEKYGSEDKMIEDETITFIKQRRSRRQKRLINGQPRADDWRYEDALMCPDRFYQARTKEQFTP